MNVELKKLLQNAKVDLENILAWMDGRVAMDMDDMRKKVGFASAKISTVLAILEE